jgi:hypothetical protein
MLRFHPNSIVPLIDPEPEQTYECDLCDFTCNYFRSIAKHVAVHLSYDVRLKYKCSYCLAEFLGRGALKMHQNKVHLNIVEKCDCECGKIANYKCFD